MVLKGVSLTWISAIWLGHALYCMGESQISVKTAEMTSVGSSLVKIPRELKLPRVEEREFKILSGEQYAKVDQKTGILTVASLMDRETICPDNREHCYVDVAVVVLPLKEKTSPTSLRIVKVEIEITDINDNAPKFENPVIEKMISEGVEVATSIRLDSAVDPDLGDNSIQRYAIRSVRGSKFPIEKYFRLGVIENIDGTKIPKLMLRRTLDREKQGVHELILEAVDGGTPAKTGTAIVRINVTDSNDNKPTFDQTVYIVKVNEHERNGTIVKQLHAVDKDTGINGKVRYKFPSVVSAEDQQIFALDPDTGAITIKNSNKLDFETKKIHHLTVEASDLGPNSASAYTTVTVKVQDINDNKPEVEVSFMDLELVQVPDSGDYDAIVREDIEVGSYLAFVTITDKDGGENGSVSCRLAGTDVFDLQSIEENTSRFLLKLAKGLDREETSSYDIDVEAWDHGDPSQSSVRTVRIKVGDVNDNSPTFVHDEFSVGVSETAAAGTVVMTLKAEDIDEHPGPNSRIAYELLKSTDSIEAKDQIFLLTEVFHINRDTGEIRLQIEGVLDAESVREPGYLTVLATDGGIPKRNATTRLKITIIDENDNDPVFKNKSYVFRFDEHSKYGCFVGQVKAEDADWTKTSNGLVTYNVERYKDNGEDDAEEEAWLQMFQIDRGKGEIHFYGNESKLDREARRGNPITINAVASDSGSPRRTARVRVDIFLEDINDNSPIVTFPDVKKDIAFVKLVVDQPSNGGEADSDSTMTNEGIFNAMARSGDRSETRWASIVTVNSADLKESDYISPTLTRVKAYDLDEGENAQISFAIVAGNDMGYFEIDVIEGNITFAPGVDLTKINMGCHVLKILVKDLGEVQMTTKTYVNIFLSHSDASNVNKSDAMKDCQNNTLYPVDEANIRMSGLDQMSTLIIIGFAILIFIILVVIVAVLIKCKCCDHPKKSRSYNCQQGSGNIYGSPIYGSPDKKKRKKDKGHKRYAHGHGTVDSRSSFHSEWTASQTQIAQEKMDLVGALPTLQSEGSVGSHNSGRDSGTGDSMPSDAYHTVVPHGEMGYPMIAFSPQGPYSQIPEQNISTFQHLPRNMPMDSRYGPRPPHKGVVTMKCTDDCLMYGHSDACWMPDSLLRAPSRMSAFKHQQDAHNMEHMPMTRFPADEGDLRYNGGDPTIPYYYDPGRKFDHPSYEGGTFGRKFTTFGDTMGHDKMNHEDPGYQMQHHDAPNSSHNGSQPPSNLSSSGVQYQHPNVHPAHRYHNPDNMQGRGRAYVNLQGSDAHQGPNNMGMEEVHSNLSSESGNNKQYMGEMPHPKQQYYPEQSMHYPAYIEHEMAPHPYYDHNPYAHGRPEFHSPYPNEMPDHGHPPNYNEDYSASNLLLSPAENGPDYRHHWEARTPRQHHPGYVPTSQQSLQHHDNRVNEEKEHLISNGNNQTSSSSNIHLDNQNGGELSQDEKTDEKLSTIDENIGATIRANEELLL